MNIALLAFDLDGTTITQHQYLPQENRLALEDAAAQGILLVPASGRMKDFLPREITALPGVRYAITANGAGVYDLATGEAVWQRLIPNEKARQVQAVLEEYDLFVEYYSQGRATTRQGDPERAFTHFGLPESKRHFLDKDYCLVPALGGTSRRAASSRRKSTCPTCPPRPCARRSGSAWRPWAAWSSPPPSRTTSRSTPKAPTRAAPCGPWRSAWGFPGKRSWPWGTTATT